MHYFSKYLSRLSLYDKSFIVGIIALLTPLILTLKTIRWVKVFQLNTAIQVIDLYKSEVLFLIGFTALGLTLLSLSNRSLIQRLFLLGLQAIALCVAFVEISAHRFFMSTGSTLDFQLFTLAFKNFDELWKLISSETPIATLVLLGVTLIVLLISPWISVKAMKPRTSEKTPVPPSQNPANKPAPWLFALGILATVSLASAATPALANANSAFSHSSFVNLVASALDTADEDEQTSLQRTSLKHVKLTPKPEQENPKNVVIVILESTRASSVTPYNESLQTTPFLQSLASKSLIAERAYAVIPHTSKALVAILCGIEPQLGMEITEASPGGIPANCLARLLASQGYETAFFQSATESFEERRQLINNMGYASFTPYEEMPTRGFEKTNYFGYEDNIMLRPSETWLKTHKNKPFFATYLTLTPHHNYRTPRRFKHENYSDNKELNKYLNAIRYTDDFVKRLMAQYKRLGLYDNTIFVFVGDHGEGFGEHGRKQHDNVIYEEGIHVPLMIYEPSHPDAQRIDTPISQIDIVPTLLDRLNFQIVDGAFPGYILTKSPEDRRVFAYCWYERRCMASISKNNKFIDHFDRMPVEFFALDKDPLEKENIPLNPLISEQYYQELVTWRANVLGMYQD